MKRLGVSFLCLALLVVASCETRRPLARKRSEEPAAPNPQVVMETSKGTVKIELFAEDAPKSVKNFLDYVDKKFYDGTIFHRVISDFMIQGGGFETGMKREKNTGPPIPNEAGNGLANERGTLAMARTGDPNSATSQFFINVKDNAFLDRANAQDRVGYAVFGRVVDGMDVVEAIRNVPTHFYRGQKDVPEEDVVIKSIRRIDASAETKDEKKTEVKEK